MPILTQLDQDFKEAMKARDAFRLDAVKMLRSALKYREIEKMKPLDEAEVIDVLAREVKKLKDALEQFRAGGRADLSEKTEREIALIEGYLPKALTEDEIKAIVGDKIMFAGEVTTKDFGRIMKEVAVETKGRADGATVSRLVKEALGG
jgi:hypothetical protein